MLYFKISSLADTKNANKILLFTIRHFKYNKNIANLSFTLTFFYIYFLP